MVIIQGLLNLEAYLDAFNRIVATGGIQFAVVDSVGCSAPTGEIQSKGGEARCLTDDTVALQARVYSKWSRLAVPAVATNKVVAILIAQIYTDINSYGGLPQTKGGNALKHATSLRLLTRRAREKQTIRVRRPDGTPKEIEVVGLRPFVPELPVHLAGVFHGASITGIPEPFGPRTVLQ